MKKIILIGLLLTLFGISFAQEGQIIEISKDTSFLGIKLFPNPAQQFVELHFPNPHSTPHHLFLVDLNGRVVRTYGDIRQDQLRISLADMSRGLYFFELRGEKSYYGRLMVE